MVLPVNPPTSLAQVKSWAKITDTVDDTVITECVDAVNRLVVGLRIATNVDRDTANGETQLNDWYDDYQLGATMLAARLFRRRNTPGGVEATGDFGVAYVRRSDPDIAQLLELGEYATPGIG